jgi:hypothetical protein
MHNQNHGAEDTTHSLEAAAKQAKPIKLKPTESNKSMSEKQASNSSLQN